MNQLIIIGAGPMGLYAAFCAGMRDINGIVLESSYTYGGQVSALYAEKRIYDIPGFYNTLGKDFISNLYQQYLRYEEMMPIKYNTMATEIIKEKDYYIVNTTKGTYYAKKVLVTNGGGVFYPTPLETKGFTDQDNVLYHVDKIETFKDKKVVILGGGDSAADWALELSKVTREVSLVHRRDNFRAHPATINEFLKNGKILTPYKIVEVVGESKVEKIILEHSKTKELINLEVDYLLVFYGIKTNKSNLENFGLKYNDEGIFVASNMQTNLEGIFAAGNGATYLGKLNMIVTGMGEVGTAIGQIANDLYPDRNTNNIYSSILVKE